MLSALSGLLTGLLLDTARRKALAVAYFGIAALFLIFAAAYGLSALREWMKLTFNLAYPDLWIAGGLAIVSVPFVCLGVWKHNERARPELYRAAAVLAAPAAARLASRTVGPRILAIGAVAVLGLWVGRQAGKR